MRTNVRVPGLSVVGVVKESVIRRISPVAMGKLTAALGSVSFHSWPTFSPP
jgi:hypothetical protein